MIRKRASLVLARWEPPAISNTDPLEKQQRVGGEEEREKRELKKNRSRHRIDEVKMEPEMAAKREAAVPKVE